MKHIFILLLSLFSPYFLFAQHSGKQALHNRHTQMVSQLLQQQRTNGKDMRTTSGVAAERVVAQSTHDSTGAITDSVSVNYTGSVGSTYDFGSMDYPYAYPYSASPMFNYAGVFTKPQVLFDTCLHWTQDPFTLVYGLYESTYSGYDANKNLVAFKHVYTDSLTNTNMSFINRFNAANNIDSGYWFRDIAGVADSDFKQFFIYNASGKLTEDSTFELHLGVWRIVSKAYYAYDASGNLTQIDYYANTMDTTFTLPLIEQEQYINTYDASNRMITVLTNQYNGASLSGYVKDTFAYTGIHTYHTSWKEYQYDPINMYWAPIFNMSKSLNTAGFPDTVNIDGFDSIMNAWVPQTMDVVNYNSFNLPDTLNEYDYDFTAFPSSPSYITVYYYQTYNNTTAVNNVTSPENWVTIYPNPATTAINILQPDLPQNEMLTITLVNASGQKVSMEKMPGQNEMQISIAGLLPGVYWVVIQDDAGNMLHRQAIVKP